MIKENALNSNSYMKDSDNAVNFYHMTAPRPHCKMCDRDRAVPQG